MNDLPFEQSVSYETISSSKLTSKNKHSMYDVITINEKVKLTKQQHQVLKIICDTYETPLSEYMQQALVEAMRFDIEEGNFSDTLLEKIGSGEDSKNDKSSPHSSDLDLFKKLQMQQV
jgi:hypothetical protein